MDGRHTRRTVLPYVISDVVRSSDRAMPRKYTLWFGFIVALSLMASIARAQRVEVYPDIDGLAAEPGAVVTRDEHGAVKSVDLERNGVSIRSERQGNKVHVAGEDRTGHGAILCVWSIYVEMRPGMDVCFPGQYHEVREYLDTEIDAMSRFIATNSLVPISRQAIEAAIADSDEQARTAVSGLTPERLAEICASSDLHQMVTDLARQSRKDRQQTINDLLSVPRPPVLNPCL